MPTTSIRRIGLSLLIVRDFSFVVLLWDSFRDDRCVPSDASCSGGAAAAADRQSGSASENKQRRGRQADGERGLRSRRTDRCTDEERRRPHEGLG